jgi:hypothetical protein
MVVLNEPLEYRDGEVLCEGHVALNALSQRDAADFTSPLGHRVQSEIQPE